MRRQLNRFGPYLPELLALPLEVLQSIPPLQDEKDNQRHVEGAEPGKAADKHQRKKDCFWTLFYEKVKRKE